MKISQPAIICALIALLSLSIGPVGAVESEGAEDLIQNLSSDSFQIREKATKDLWDMGEEASEALLEATLSDDPEMAFRAAEVLRKVELRITPETPDEILSLVRSFRDATTRQKSDLLQELRDKKAYYQSLKLFSMESPEVRAELSDRMRGVAIIAAREAILKDDIKTATELLRLSCADGNHIDLMALACLYQTAGQLAGQLAEPNPPQGVSEVIWKSFLLRANGDLDGAIAHAEEHGQIRLLAGLKILKGDPTLWLQYNGWGEKDRQALPEYIEIALKRWNGEMVAKADFEPLKSKLEIPKKKNSRNQNADTLSALAALGEIDAVEKVQLAEYPNLAFIYHLSREEITEALGAIGLDPEKPDYVAWVAQRFANIEKEKSNGNDALELEMLAGFMERRGLHRELNEAFSKPLKKYQKRDEEDFLNFLSRFFDSGDAASDFAVGQAAVWAGDDAGRWERIFEIALGNHEVVMEWLGWIREIKPEITHRETLEGMLALFGKSYRPGNLRLKWMETVWGVIQKTEDADLKEGYLKRVISLSIILQDVNNAIKAWDQLGEEARESTRWNAIDRYITAMGRWEQVAEMFESDGQIEKLSDPGSHAYFAAILRQVGLEKKARIHDRMTRKLALGYVPSCIRIGDEYSFCGDDKKASEWFRRAVLQADVNDVEFISAITKYAESSLNSGNWDVAAACYEAMAHNHASQEYVSNMLTEIAKVRLNADLARAMSILPEREGEALELLADIHRKFETDATLADHFFPALREAGRIGELNEWFGKSWGRVVAVIEAYPECHNSRNSVAWLASRAGLKLEEAEAYLEKAIEMTPEQPAYLDTMAELNFAQKDREAAVRWSDQAVRHSPFEGMIRMQNFRFKNQK
jgi:tetratricopeptide (TPR) repeat protein